MTEEFNSARRAIALLAVLILTLAALTGCTVEYYEDEANYQDDYYDEYYEDEPEVLFDEFEELQFWGQWFDLAPYGWVWRPTVVLGWRPYDNGHWIWSDLGWTWVSYEPFGWATYHYGFWAYDFAWGWVWIPAYDWYPSRVDWYIYDDYIAWSPMPPPGFHIGDPWTPTDVYAWHVVHTKHFIKSDIGRYHKGYKKHYRVKDRSSVMAKAPEAAQVEYHTRRTLRPISIEMSQMTVGQRTLQKMKLPEAELERVSRFQERTEKRIRAKDTPRQREVKKRSGKKPYQDDRIIAPKRDKDGKVIKPREEKKKPEDRVKKERPVKEKPAEKKPIKKRPEKKKRTRKG